MNIKFNILKNGMKKLRFEDEASFHILYATVNDKYIVFS